MTDLAKLKEYIQKNSYKENFDKPFKLASGKESPFYFNLKQTLFEPQMLAIAIAETYKLIVQTLGQPPRATAGLTMGSDPLVYGISLYALKEEGKNVLPIVVRKKTKDHGSQQKAEGLLNTLEKDRSIVLIDDVITTGGSTLQAFEALKGMGYIIDKAFCLVDRQEGGLENMAKQGVELISLFKAKDFRLN